MRKIFISLAIIFIVWGGWAYWHHQNAKDPAVGDIITVKTGPIKETVEATGNVAPLNRVEIKPAISGRIESYLVDEGSSVVAGQVIAWMSSSDRVAILDAARSRGPKEFKKWENVYKPTPIVSPISGVIILRNIVSGQMVDASTILFAISDRLIVVAQVDESDIGRIRIGMTASIVLDSYPDQTTVGRVFDILHEGVNTNNIITYNVKINPVGNAPEFFKSQMTANVSFIVQEKESALLVPASAVTQADGHYKVLVPGPNGQFAERQITIGITDGNNDEVLSGLAKGEQIILNQKLYVPQEAPTSPLAFGGKKKK